MRDPRGRRAPFPAAFLFFLLSPLFLICPVSGWFDETHLAVAKAAGYGKWYNAAGADIAKVKADTTERFNHYVSGSGDVTPEEVLRQIDRYNDPRDAKGHLYGAIIASVLAYQGAADAGKYPEYHLAYCAHYIGDLSQPEHHIPGREENERRHKANEQAAEKDVLKNLVLIERSMYSILLRPEHLKDDLAREIARIANISRSLALAQQKEGRTLSPGEIFQQLGHSASLLRAVLKALGR
ncbi:MAG: hypothetical protein K8I29_03410 [Alphaproteobacteria bacterium]|uniref:Uncharacterized protein n=1 Tax=Candidatus Nitrobium versatile TaxID=2884831 RepID=A0A953JAS8_9BACT|nr:hypothetical protein [Candidatus Nitrobium versatile]